MKRYTLFCEYDSHDDPTGDLIECDEGEWVKFSDVEPMLRRLAAAEKVVEASREALELAATLRGPPTVARLDLYQAHKEYDEVTGEKCT